MISRHRDGTSGANAGARKRNERHRRWAVLPWLVVGLAAAHAHAAPPVDKTEVRIRYRPEDLASPDAARILLRRIGDAALEACGASPFSLAEYKAATKNSGCWRAAVDDAVRRLGSPLLGRLATEGQRYE